MTHATRGSPSTSTVQHPHCPCGEQPSLTETTPSCSRSTERSDSPGAASTSTWRTVAHELHPMPSCVTGRQDRGMAPEPSSSRALSRRSVPRHRSRRRGRARRSRGAARSATPRPPLDTKTFFPLVLSSDLYASPAAQRMVFALSHSSGQGDRVRQRTVGDGAVPVAPTARRGRATTEDHLRPRRPAEGPRRLRDAADVRHARESGRSRRRRRARRSRSASQVNAAPDRPSCAGEAAPRAASPTAADTLGVDPICTRQPDVPAAHAVARHGDRRGQARRRALRHAGPLPVAVLRPRARRAARRDERLPGPDHVRAHRDLPGHRPAPRSSRRSTRGRSRASRGCSASTATGTIQSRIDGAFGGNEMKALLDGLRAA